MSGGLFEEFDAAVEGFAEGDFFFLDEVDEVLGILFELREHFAHGVDDDGDELVEEGVLEVELLAAEADSAAEDAAEDVAAAVVGGGSTVGDGEGEAADVVGDDTEGDIVAEL